MPKTAFDEVYGPDGKLISSVPRVVADTKIEKALAWLDANDPTAVTTLAQAKVILTGHHKILRAMLTALQKGILDEPEDGSI